MAANTENKRLYFSLQKKIEHATQLQMELDNEKSTCTRLVGQLNEYEDEIKFAAERINNFETEVDSLQSLLTIATARHDAEKKRLDNHIAQLQASLKSAENFIVDIKKKCAKDCDELRLEISTQNERTKALSRTKNSLQARISQIQSVAVPSEPDLEKTQKKNQQ